MKIAVNTRLMIKGKMDGIGWFTKETMIRIAAEHPEHEFFFLFDRDVHPSFKFPANVTTVIVRPVTRLPWLLRFWNSVSVPMALKRINPDLYISPDGFLPPEPPVPSVVVIHDLNFEHYPHFIPKQYRSFYHKWVRRSAHQATHILTVSHFSKHDIVQTYKVPSDKIDVVYSGLNGFISAPSSEILQRVTLTHGLDVPYFIVPGTIHPRKNIHGTIRAFSRFRENTGQHWKLVFAGNNKGFSGEMKEALEQSAVKNDIVFTGRIADEEMNALIWGAEALLFVSFFEGFGLPLLEAAAAGIPAVSSTTSSMAEIARDAALLVDPHNITAIANAMTRICNEPELRKSLVEASSALPVQYSWDRTAELVWQSVLKVANPL